MASNHLNTNKEKSLIEDKELELLKMFANELLVFREAIQVFSESRSITPPNVSGLCELLVERLDFLIFELDHHLQDVTGPKMSNDRAKALRCAYTVMKEKLLKYNMQMRRKLVFPISTLLDPRFKLKHIPYDEHNFFMEILLNMLKSVCIIEVSSSMPINDLLASSSHKRSKVMMQFIEQKSNRCKTLDEKSTKVELEDYLCEPCIDLLYVNPRISVLAEEFLSICASNSPVERLFSTCRGIIIFRRGRLASDTLL